MGVWGIRRLCTESYECYNLGSSIITSFWYVVYMNYSLTITGVVVSVMGSLLLHFGFSEACSNEIVTLAPVLVGGALSYFGRLRQGDINALGMKKPQ